jgi:hypothetical protein
MRASLSRRVIGPAGQPCGGSKQIADYEGRRCRPAVRMLAHRLPGSAQVGRSTDHPHRGYLARERPVTTGNCARCVAVRRPTQVHSSARILSSRGHRHGNNRACALEVSAAKRGFVPQLRPGVIARGAADRPRTNNHRAR